MFDAVPTQSVRWFRAKNVVFAIIAAMTIYVLYHNERFLIDPAHPVWQHYRDLGVFLLVHGVAGACALILAPMQFSDRLRMRFTKLHRVVGRTYVTAALVLAPFGVYTQWLNERLGLFPTSFTIETIIQASILMITTAIGLVFARKRMIPQHREWMTRSYAAALTFVWIRVVLGVDGLGPERGAERRYHRDGGLVLHGDVGLARRYRDRASGFSTMASKSPCRAHSERCKFTGGRSPRNLRRQDPNDKVPLSDFGWALCERAWTTAIGAQDTSIPDFAPSPDVGWVSYGPEFIPPASGPKPVAADPAHPFIANAIEYRAGQPDVSFPDRQSTFAVADLTNPILQPWARDELRKLNEIVLSGKPLFERRTGCWPSGVPAFNLYVVAADVFHSDADQGHDDFAHWIIRSGTSI